MDSYRIKLEARQFFEPRIRTVFATAETWAKSYGVSMGALEKAEPVWVTFGVEGEKSTNLGSWSRNDGVPTAKFAFTVNVDGMSLHEYEKVLIYEVMDEIQKVLNEHFKK